MSVRLCHSHCYFQFMESSGPLLSFRHLLLSYSSPWPSRLYSLHLSISCLYPPVFLYLNGLKETWPEIAAAYLYLSVASWEVLNKKSITQILRLRPPNFSADSPDSERIKMAIREGAICSWRRRSWQPNMPNPLPTDGQQLVLEW